MEQTTILSHGSTGFKRNNLPTWPNTRRSPSDIRFGRGAYNSEHFTLSQSLFKILDSFQISFSFHLLTQTAVTEFWKVCWPFCFECALTKQEKTSSYPHWDFNANKKLWIQHANPLPCIHTKEEVPCDGKSFTTACRQRSRISFIKTWWHHSARIACSYLPRIFSTLTWEHVAKDALIQNNILQCVVREREVWIRSWMFVCPRARRTGNDARKYWTCEEINGVDPGKQRGKSPHWK